MTAAIGLAHAAQALGADQRREVELVAEAADYLAQVEELDGRGP